ncbi:unannotated protein [freshwater metagenome]|uniref:Unannotated protein n=1 Tax=freshwater metagenome TaxID=449393 RepID=A0A6J6MK69_9ZZZZ
MYTFPCCKPAPNGTRVLLPVSEYVFVPNALLPSLRSLSVNVHAPVPPGTLSVGDSEDDTHELGVTTAPKYNGTRSPEPVPAGNAASAVGSPASPAAALRFESDEQAEASKANERPIATVEMAKRRRIEGLRESLDSNGDTIASRCQLC